MELTHLRTFRMVAETLNFTRAAERLGLTQSAVSHQILGLESELGEPLFIRTKRGVKLSSAGLIVLEYAERILQEEQALKEKIGGPESEPTGRVRVAAATQALVFLFAPLFEQFMQSFPQVELSFRTTPSTDQTIADIFNGRADVGFASLPVSAPSLQVTKLFEDELMLVVSSTHRFGAKKEASLKEIQRERLILFERGASIRRATDQFFDKVGIKPELALESNDTYFIKLMVEHGWGISLLPGWSVREEIAAGKLAKLKITGHRLRRNVEMVSLGRFQPSGTRAFTTFIHEHRETLQERASG